MMWTPVFWRASAGRAIRTFAQTLFAVASVSGLGLIDAPWPAWFSASGMAAVLSLLMSIGSSASGDDDSIASGEVLTGGGAGRHYAPDAP